MCPALNFCFSVWKGFFYPNRRGVFTDNVLRKLQIGGGKAFRPDLDILTLAGPSGDVKDIFVPFYVGSELNRFLFHGFFSLFFSHACEAETQQIFNTKRCNYTTRRENA